jgi:hypothetical protein
MLADMLTKIQAASTNPVIERAFKTFVEVTAGQAAVYTTLVPAAPDLKVSAAVSLGATALSVGWNLLIAWATKTKSARLDRIAAAIDKAVDARLKEQGQPDPA